MGNIFGGGGGPPPPYQFIQCQGNTSDCCNGLDGLCDFGVDEIMWATSHNAMSSKAGGLPILYNHLFELEDSLDTGFRGFGLDVCKCNGEYQLCHGVCYIGARSPDEVFGNIVDFLMQNPTEVILFTFEIDNNADETVSLDEFDEVLSAVPGLKAMTYVHTDGSPWPTLGELKAAEKVRSL